MQDYGEDSDFVRVRVRGLPPSASDLQFIDSTSVYAAHQRQVTPLADDPLVAGLDLARGGSDSCVLRFRRGADARSIPPLRLSGQEARDSMLIVTKVAEALGHTYGDDGRKIHTLFVDATGGSVGGPIADRLRQLGHANVVDVQFGGVSPDPRYANRGRSSRPRTGIARPHHSASESRSAEQPHDRTGTVKLLANTLNLGTLCWAPGRSRSQRLGGESAEFSST